MKLGWILSIFVFTLLLYAAVTSYRQEQPAYRQGEVLYCYITTMTEQGQILSYPCPGF